MHPTVAPALEFMRGLNTGADELTLRLAFDDHEPPTLFVAPNLHPGITAHEALRVSSLDAQMAGDTPLRAWAQSAPFLTQGVEGDTLPTYTAKQREAANFFPFNPHSDHLPHTMLSFSAEGGAITGAELRFNLPYHHSDTPNNPMVDGRITRGVALRFSRPEEAAAFMGMCCALTGPFFAWELYATATHTRNSTILKGPEDMHTLRFLDSLWRQRDMFTGKIRQRSEPLARVHKVCIPTAATHYPPHLLELLPPPTTSRRRA